MRRRDTRRTKLSTASVTSVTASIDAGEARTRDCVRRPVEVELVDVAFRWRREEEVEALEWGLLLLTALVVRMKCTAISEM